MIRQAAGLCLAVVGLDQATKLAATLAAAGQTSGLVVPVHNPRFSLGLASAPLPVMALLMAAGILAAGGYSLRAAHRGRLPVWVPGLLVGGASSNLLDRLLLGAVRDFLATPWAVINLADLAVVAAVIGAILAHLTRRPPAGPILGKGGVSMTRLRHWATTAMLLASSLALLVAETAPRAW
jgi:signal peptidase II